MFIQLESAECGLICLAIASARFGAEHDLAELRRRFPVSSRGLSLKQLIEIASALDLHGRGIKCETEELTKVAIPAILHWGLNHFVVLEKATSRHLFIHDPARGRQKIDMAEARQRFSGVCLELSTAPGFKKRREKAQLSIWSWLRLGPSLYGGLAQVLILSALMQIYIVISPFYMQLAIDQAALKGDMQLLVSLAVGFGLFAAFNAVAAVLRGLAVQKLSAQLSWDMSMRLFRHLIRLPLYWFQKRRLADTISRFDAINPIRDLVSGGLISGVIDGALAITTLIMMFVFSWQLALPVVFGVALYIAIKLITLPSELRLGAEILTARIYENSKRIETIKAIQTIKVMSAETEQENQWSNRYAELLTRSNASGVFNVSTSALNAAIDAIVTTIVIFNGAKLAIEGQMTIGILYAFMSYKTQFSLAAVNLINLAVQWKLNDVYSHRLSDIVLHPKEPGIDGVDVSNNEIFGRIEIENLSFRYSSYDPFIFKSLNFVIEPGELVAIVGPSGIGKSTLLKIISGLYPPTSGEVRIDGIPIASWGAKTLRKSYGVVMQDDELLSGSIAENVAFFDENINMDRVWEVLDAVAMKSDVMRMQMKAETFVGDMGSALSGGQKQRLLIARALYKNPKILFLDEATSHLDLVNEAKLNAHLKSLQITRIIIAHRPETIRTADRIYDMRTNQIGRAVFYDQGVANVSEGIASE